LNALYHIQAEKSTACRCISSISQKLHIIRPKTVLSLSGEYIIKPQEKICTLTHDDIQPKGLMISTTLRAVMICQTCGLDKKSRIKTIRLFWCTLRDSPLAQ
jgi:hypothetical protein